MESCEIVEEILRQDDTEQEEDGLMSSYAIEIDSGNREMTCESNDVDEAIASALEKFQTHCSEERPIEELLNENNAELLNEHQLSEGPPDSSPSVDHQQEEGTEEEEKSKIQEEMHLLDEKIRL